MRSPPLWAYHRTVALFAQSKPSYRLLWKQRFLKLYRASAAAADGFRRKLELIALILDSEILWQGICQLNDF